MNDLAGSEVHVVYSARDLARQLPAAWQESIKQGRRWSFRAFLDAGRARRRPWFLRAFDLPTVLGTWGAALPPERVHVVTVPHDGRRRRGDVLWLRFCQAFGIDPAWAPLDSERANRSLGIAETQVLRRLNRGIDRATRARGGLRRPDPRDARPGPAGPAPLGRRSGCRPTASTGPRSAPSSGSTGSRAAAST